MEEDIIIDRVADGSFAFVGSSLGGLFGVTAAQISLIALSYTPVTISSSIDTGFTALSAIAGCCYGAATGYNIAKNITNNADRIHKPSVIAGAFMGAALIGGYSLVPDSDTLFLPKASYSEKYIPS